MRSPQFSRKAGGVKAAGSDEDSFDIRTELNMSPRKRSTGRTFAKNSSEKKKMLPPTNREKALLEVVDSAPDESAKAAADALGRDLEAMGYNLDCKSFITKESSGDSDEEDRYAGTGYGDLSYKKSFGSYRRKLQMRKEQQAQSGDDSEEDKSMLPSVQENKILAKDHGEIAGKRMRVKTKPYKDLSEVSSSSEDDQSSESGSSSSWSSSDDDDDDSNETNTLAKLTTDFSPRAGAKKAPRKPPAKTNQVKSNKVKATIPFAGVNPSKRGAQAKSQFKKLAGEKPSKSSAPAKRQPSKQVTSPRPAKSKVNMIFIEGMSIVDAGGGNSVIPSKQEKFWAFEGEGAKVEERVEERNPGNDISEARDPPPATAETAAPSLKKGRSWLPFTKGHSSWVPKEQRKEQLSFEDTGELEPQTTVQTEDAVRPLEVNDTEQRNPTPASPANTPAKSHRLWKPFQKNGEAKNTKKSTQSRKIPSLRISTAGTPLNPQEKMSTQGHGHTSQAPVLLETHDPRLIVLGPPKAPSVVAGSPPNFVQDDFSTVGATAGAIATALASITPKTPKQVTHLYQFAAEKKQGNVVILTAAEKEMDAPLLDPSASSEIKPSVCDNNESEEVTLSPRKDNTQYKTKQVARVSVGGKKNQKRVPLFSLFKKKKEDCPNRREMAAIQENTEGFDVQMITTIGSTGTISISATGTVISIDEVEEVEVEKNRSPVVFKKVKSPVVERAKSPVTKSQETKTKKSPEAKIAKSPEAKSPNKALSWIENARLLKSQPSSLSLKSKPPPPPSPALQLASTFSDFVEAIFASDTVKPIMGVEQSSSHLKLEANQSKAADGNYHNVVESDSMPSADSSKIPKALPLPEKQLLRVLGVTPRSEAAAKPPRSVKSKKKKQKSESIKTKKEISDASKPPRSEKSKQNKQKTQSIPTTKEASDASEKKSIRSGGSRRSKPSLSFMRSRNAPKPKLAGPYPVEYGDDNCSVPVEHLSERVSKEAPLLADKVGNDPKLTNQGFAKQPEERPAPIPDILKNDTVPTNTSLAVLKSIASSLPTFPSTAAAMGSSDSYNGTACSDSEAAAVSVDGNESRGGDTWNEIVDASRVVGKAFSRVEKVTSVDNNDGGDKTYGNILSMMSDESSIGDVEKALEVLKKHATRLGVRESDLLQTLKFIDEESLIQHLKSIEYEEEAALPHSKSDGGETFPDVKSDDGETFLSSDEVALPNVKSDDDETFLSSDEVALPNVKSDDGETFLSLDEVALPNIKSDDGETFLSLDEGGSFRSLTLGEELLYAFQLYTGSKKPAA